MIDIEQLKEKESKYWRLKMLQRVPIVLAQAKLGNGSEDLVTEVREIVYFLLEKRKSPKKYKII